MPGRKFSSGSSSYRYGFNGHERSTEINSDGNSTTAEFWQYDARLGRRWNRDPKPIISISPYATFLNNPIYFNDPLGDTCINGETYEGGNSRSATTLPDVTVTSEKKNVAQGSSSTIPTAGSNDGGVWGTTKDIAGTLKDAVVESVKDVFVFGASATNAFVTDNLGGVGRIKSNHFTGHPISQKVGERVGDGLALIWGSVETIGGGALLVGGGVSFIIPGIGAVTGPTGLAIGTAGVAHGTVVTIPTAWNNLMKVEQTNEEAHSNPPENTESPIVNSNTEVPPSGYSETKEFGRQHGQQVYKKGKKYISRDVDSHSGGVWKVFEKKGGKLNRIGTADKDLNIFTK